MDYILECLSLTKKYSTVTALDKINLSIPKGKWRSLSAKIAIIFSEYK